MSEEITEKAGISRLEKNVFILMFEFVAFIVCIMFWSTFRMIDNLQPGLLPQGLADAMLYGFIITLIVVIIHGIYLLFLALILKRDEEIKELSKRSYKLDVYIIPKKKVTMKTSVRRSVKPLPIADSKEQATRILGSTMMRYICRKLVQKEVPVEFKLDMIFKDIKKHEYWGDFQPINEEDNLQAYADEVGESQEMIRFLDSAEAMSDKMIDEIFQSDQATLDAHSTDNINAGPKEFIKNFLSNQKKIFNQLKKEAADLHKEEFEAQELEDADIERKDAKKDESKDDKTDESIKKDKFLDQKKKKESRRKKYEEFIYGTEESKDLRNFARFEGLIDDMMDRIENVVDYFSLHEEVDLQPFIYFFDEPISVDNEMSFKEAVSINKGERKILGELGDLFGESEPKAAIIWKPYSQEDNEKMIWKYNEALDDYVKSFQVEGDYFYLGSAAGIPILLDIMSVDKLQAFYDARFTIAGLNNLKLMGLTFLLIALAERWDRRNQTEERNILYSQVSDLQQQINTKEITTYLRNLSKEVKDRKSEYQVAPTKIDISFVIPFILGLLIGIILTFVIIQSNPSLLNNSLNNSSNSNSILGVIRNFIKL